MIVLHFHSLRDRAKAEPVLEAARLALENIEKNQLTELKSFASPPETVKFVMNMVGKYIQCTEVICWIVLCAVVLFKWVDEGRIIPEDKRTWTEAKNTIGPVEKFLQRLRNFQVAKVNPFVTFSFRQFHLQVTPQVRDIIDKLNATLMKVSKANSTENLIQQITVKSAAAGGIYTWLDSKISLHSTAKYSMFSS